MRPGDVPAERLRGQLLEHLAGAPTMGIPLLCHRTGAGPRDVGNAMRLLLQNGQVERLGRGVYRLAGHTDRITAHGLQPELAPSGGASSPAAELDQPVPESSPLSTSEQASAIPVLAPTGRLALTDAHVSWVERVAEVTQQTPAQVVERALDFYLADDDWGGTVGPWAVLRECCRTVVEQPGDALETTRMAEALLRSLAVELENVVPVITWMRLALVGTAPLP